MPETLTSETWLLSAQQANHSSANLVVRQPVSILLLNPEHSHGLEKMVHSPMSSSTMQVKTCTLLSGDQWAHGSTQTSHKSLFQSQATPAKLSLSQSDGQELGHQFIKTARWLTDKSQIPGVKVHSHHHTVSLMSLGKSTWMADPCQLSDHNAPQTWPDAASTVQTAKLSAWLVTSSWTVQPIVNPEPTLGHMVSKSPETNGVGSVVIEYCSGASVYVHRNVSLTHGRLSMIFPPPLMHRSVLTYVLAGADSGGCGGMGNSAALKTYLG